MKLSYPICCGVDVHKKSIVATIVSTDKDGISTYQQKNFLTINSDIERFHCWLIENNCYHVCMESTGKYWIPIFNVLESDIHVTLTHPKYVAAIKGKKTDKKDSKWIADLFKFDMVRSSFIPLKDIRDLREIARYRFKLVYMKASEKNRIQNSMTVSNIDIVMFLVILLELQLFKSLVIFFLLIHLMSKSAGSILRDRLRRKQLKLLNLFKALKLNQTKP